MLCFIVYTGWSAWDDKQAWKRNEITILDFIFCYYVWLFFFHQCKVCKENKNKSSYFDERTSRQTVIDQQILWLLLWSIDNIVYRISPTLFLRIENIVTENWEHDVWYFSLIYILLFTSHEKSGRFFHATGLGKCLRWNEMKFFTDIKFVLF